VARPPVKDPTPEELLTFYHSKQFDAAWKELGLSDEHLTELQWQIIWRPLNGPVMRGTDGLRKMRFEPQDSSQGRRGSFRVCYVYFPEYQVVYLVVVFAKNQHSNLPESAKKAIRQLIADIHRYLAREENQ